MREETVRSNEKHLTEEERTPNINQNISRSGVLTARHIEDCDLTIASTLFHKKNNIVILTSFR